MVTGNSPGDGDPPSYTTPPSDDSPSNDGPPKNNDAPNRNGSDGSEADPSESLRDALATDDDTLGPESYRDL